MIAPHRLDDLQRRHRLGTRDDYARRIGRAREDLERQRAEALEEPRAQRADALVHRRSKCAMHGERLPQPDIRTGVDGAGLEARRLVLQLDVAVEIHRGLGTPAHPQHVELRKVADPHRADAERTVEPLVAEERVRVGAERVHVDRDLPRGLRAVDDDRPAGVVRDARRLRHRQDLTALARDERDDERRRAVRELAPEVGEERGVVAMRQDGNPVAAQTARERRHERAAMLLGRRHDRRPRLARHADRKRHAADQRVEGIGRGLRERDAGRAAGITDEVGEVGARRVERGVVGVVADVGEHPDAREPCAIAIGNACRDREGRP